MADLDAAEKQLQAVFGFKTCSAERVNSALKDSYGGRSVRVRGHAKVLCHLMFGILTLTVEQI